MRLNHWIIRSIALLALALCQMARAQSAQYSYDNLWRLTRAAYDDGTVIEYVYDNAGNRLMKTVTPPPNPLNHPPAPVNNPGVPNGAVNTAATPILTWPAAADPDAGDAVAYYLYFGPTSDPPLVYSGWGTNWAPGQLDCFTTYFWYVVACDNHNATSTSPRWSFTTGDVPPAVDFSAEPISGPAPLTVSFQDQSRYPCGTITSWQWDFYDRGVVDATNRNPMFTYPAAGNYTVKLQVGDEHGGFGTIVKTNFVSVLGSNIINLAALDLKVESAGPARNLVVSYTVTNTGSFSLVGKWQWPDVFYLSQDASTLDSSASSLAEFDESQALPAGAVYRRTNMVTMPDIDLRGQYLWLNADDDDQLLEANLLDNARAVPADTRLPDLVPGPLALRGSAVAGQTINVTYSVTNVGPLDILGVSQAAVGFYDGFYLSTNSVWDTTATPIGSCEPSGTLASGASYSATATLTLPVWPAGNYYLTLVVNDGDTIVESDNSNHTLTILLALAAPDLAALSLAAPPAPASDATIPVTYAVRNQGNATAVGPWTDTLYLSTNTVWDDQAVTLGSMDQPGPLPPQAAYTATNAIQLPGWPAGTYYLLLQVDSSGAVSDALQSNNLRVIPITLQPPLGLPDLVPISLVAPSSAVAGASIQVIDVVTNSGGNPLVGDWSDQLWLSSGPVLDNSATLLATEDFSGPLAGWSTYRATNVVTLVDDPPGAYYLIIQANAFGSVNEATLTNNELALPFLCQAVGLSAVGYLAQGGFQLAVTGALGAKYTLWGSTDLENWQSVFDFTCTNEPTRIIDPDALGLDARFYYVAPSLSGP